MKKSFVLLIILVLLVSGTGYYAQTNLLKEKDQVQFTETVIYGDKSVVDGVTVEMHNQYQSQLFWHSTYEIGEEPKVSTDYEFYPWTYSDYTYHSYGDLVFLVDCSNTDYRGIEDDETTYHGLELAMRELYEQTGPGEMKTTTVFIKDYVDYYTFGLDVELPQNWEEGFKGYYGYNYIFEDELREDIAKLEAIGGYDKDELEKLKQCLEDVSAFQEFFRIPVLETEAYTLAIAKDQSGVVIGTADSHVSGGSGSGEIEIPDVPSVEGLDSFDFRIHSFYDNGDCYFTFDPHTYNGNLVDVSLIPGGYGLYHFPYDKEGNIYPEKLEMVYALDTSVSIEGIMEDESGKNILLFTCEAERLYMSVIDRETMTLVEKFDIGAAEYGYSCWPYEDYMVVSAEQLMLFTMDEETRFSVEFTVDKDKMESLIETSRTTREVVSYESSFDWNGETLLIGHYIYNENMGRSPSFCVAAVDETGLLYYGEYHSSLETCDVTRTYNPCQPDTSKEEIVTVSWD